MSCFLGLNLNKNYLPYNLKDTKFTLGTTLQAYDSNAPSLYSQYQTKWIPISFLIEKIDDTLRTYTRAETSPRKLREVKEGNKIRNSQVTPLLPKKKKKKRKRKVEKQLNKH